MLDRLVIYESYAFYKVWLFHVLPNHTHPSRHRDSDWHETWRNTKACKVDTKFHPNTTVKHVCQLWQDLNQNRNLEVYLYLLRTLSIAWYRKTSLEKQNHSPNKAKAVDCSSEFNINQMFIFCWKVFASDAPLCRIAVFSQNFAELVFSRQVVNCPGILFFAKKVEFT